MLDMLLFSLALVGLVFVLAYMWDLAFGHKGDFPATQFLFILALFLFSTKGVLTYIIAAFNVPAFDTLYYVLEITSMLCIIVAFGMYMWKGEKPHLGDDDE